MQKAEFSKKLFPPKNKFIANDTIKIKSICQKKNNTDTDWMKIFNVDTFVDDRYTTVGKCVH